VYLNQYHVIFCPKYRRKVLVGDIEKEKRKTQRYLDRSKRINNQNYNEDGTIKQGVRLRWNYSKGYKKASGTLLNFSKI
jgi:hypothetical protein